jgi:DNA (cytosine-5)-methyltransferase 1
MAAMINVHVEALDEGGYVATSEDVQGLGAQGGKESGLVNELFRLLRTNDVPHVLLENVSFILALGKGHAMRHIAASLEELEYRWAYRIVDTRAFGLPQRRQRLFLVASRVFEPSDVVMRGNLPDGTSAPVG